MQMITMQQEPSSLGMPMYAANPGADHPTPAAPDRGSKPNPKPKPARKTGKKK